MMSLLFLMDSLKANQCFVSRMSKQAAPASHFHKSSKILDNKYKLGFEIGKGAHGRVYEGLDVENGDFVAIKQVSLENITQEGLNPIMQEIDLLKNLNHKNIVKYIGSFKTKTHLHIILEYAENGSFASMIKPNKFGPLPESVVAIYIAQVLEGLSYLHDQGVIHLDIKGANILMTKEGIVKLADFGVATKLTEANVNTQSAVGSPYWMAPEVIESTAKKTSDIWSVGCTVIELLTSVPPYYDLVPMSALYRIVEDPHPPIPDWFSPDVTDFLHQCFQKDLALRPDAETLLQHPWILKSRRILQSSIGRNIQQQTLDGLLVEDHGNEESSDGEKWMRDAYAFAQEKARTSNETSSENFDISNLEEQGVRPKVGRKDDPQPTSADAEHDRKASQDLTSAIHDNPASQSIAKELSPTLDDVTRGIIEVHKQGEHEGFSIRENNFSDAKNKIIMIDDHEGKSAFLHMNIRENKPQKQDQVDVYAPASTSLMDRENGYVRAAEKNVLATKFKGQMDQKRVESEQGNRDEENFLCRMMGALRGNVLDRESVAIDENFRAENILPAQAVEFGRLVSSLKLDASGDVIVSACQKLIVFFQERPEQKLVFITQHGLLPLVDLLEIPDDRVICSILQLINQLVKDNSDYLENACFIGLVPVVLNFALPDRLEDIRMQAAFFLQQLCQCSSFTLQMFIACSGLPTLVSFLEPDYAKYREMVHLAVDGIWQIFKIETCTPRNDFCRIAAKSGILIRLVNTLHSLNEATRLAPISGAWSIPADSKAPHPRSGQSDLTAAPRMDSGRVDPEKQIPISKVFGWTTLSSSENIECMGTPMGGSISTTNKDRVIEANGIKQQKSSKLYSDKSRTQVELASNGSAGDNVRPLLSLLQMEPPSRHVSDHLEYLHHFSGVERHESGLPLLHVASEKKRSEELKSRKEQPVGLTTSTDANCSTSAKFSRTTSCVLSESGVQNAIPGSTTSSKLLFKTIATLNSDVAKCYFDKVADLLLEFALADSSVKLCMCNQSILSRLFQMFTRIEPPILLKLLKCINHLSTEPNCLDHLQKADAIRYLIPNLEVRERTPIGEIQNEVLNALCNLCKLNKRRQEQAAENGIIPHLVHFILSDSSLKQYALPLLCDMAHASHNSREQLRIHGGLDVYLSLLDDELWCVPALDSLAVCLAYDNDKKRVEQVLLRKDVVLKLVNFFQWCPEQYFVNILEPFLKIITKSSRINTSLAVNGLSPLLIARLNHQDAVARLNLLKLIKAVYEHHPRPKQLIVENDLPHKLQILIEERRDGQIFGGQVLVKQLATALLKALHINTVL